LSLGLITGLAGELPTPEERAFLRDAQPCGLILFQRNCRTPDQVRRLVGEATAAIGGADVLVLIDQEGGRVCRLRPPQWRSLPPARAYGTLFARDAARGRHAAELAARLTAADLRDIGINTNCVPVLDVPVPGAHDIIGTRAYGETPAVVAELGRAVADGLMAGGVLPVMKHMPGHGRAGVDSHLALPRVGASQAELAAADFAPFRALADLPAGMTAHVVFTALDATQPASISPVVVGDIIRRDIGFDGLLMSDDLSMQALSGTMRERAEAVVAAGSDVVLHCNGDLAEMEQAAAGATVLAAAALRRYRRCLAVVGAARPFDRNEAETTLSEVLAAEA
jgi:beta-N-acetylhexosaminidase